MSCFTSLCTQKQVANTTIIGLIYQLSYGTSRLKYIRIMTCLCPLNITKCSQVRKYWWAVSRLWLMRFTTINVGKLNVSQLGFWGPPSLLQKKVYGGGSFNEGKAGVALSLLLTFNYSRF